MSSKCKNCGGPIRPGAIKCIYCGNPLPVEEERPQASGAPVNDPTPIFTSWFNNQTVTTVPTAPTTPTNSGKDVGYNVFADANWQSIWTDRRKKSKNLGIILTDTRELKERGRFIESLKGYIEKKAKANIDYCLLDLASQKVAGITTPTCEKLVSLLDTIYSVEVPNYLLIVGDYSVIPCAEWDNECGDSDETVLSDLAYVTLDTDSPWEGGVYVFDGLTQVGRIPTCAKSNFDEARIYFDNTAGFKPYKSAKAFAYSALEWEKTSRVEFTPVSPDLITSPKYTSDPATALKRGYTTIKSIDDKYNLLCFNLHGSDASHAWYGQDDRIYPEAVRKSLFPTKTDGYVICTEACYGARPIINVGKEYSIVNYTLTNKCIAFVGSTKIAYGQANGAMSAADIIAGTFTDSVAKGITVGQAFLLSLDKLLDGSMSEVAIKTLAEFALYGDPSVTLVENKGAKTYSSAKNLSKSTKKKDSSRAFKLVSLDGGSGMSNYSTADHAKAQMVAYSVRVNGQNYMATNFSAMAGIEPKVFKLLGGKGYRAIYSKVEDGIKTVVRVHTDENGNVDAVYTSK